MCEKYQDRMWPEQDFLRPLGEQPIILPSMSVKGYWLAVSRKVGPV